LDLFFPALLLSLSILLRLMLLHLVDAPRIADVMDVVGAARGKRLCADGSVQSVAVVRAGEIPDRVQWSTARSPTRGFWNSDCLTQTQDSHVMARAV
jgi:hypothetical protein